MLLRRGWRFELQLNSVIELPPEKMYAVQQCEQQAHRKIFGAQLTELQEKMKMNPLWFAEML